MAHGALHSDDEWKWCWRGCWIGTASDIHDAKTLEASLRVAEQQSAATLELLEMLHSKAPIGFGFIDRDFRILHLNEPLAAANGSTVDEQRGRLVSDVVPHALAAATRSCTNAYSTRRGNTRRRDRGPCDRRPGADAQLPDEPVPGQRGRRADRHRRRRGGHHRTQGRRAAIRFQADLLAAVGQAVVAVDLERTIIYWNRAAALLYGWSAAEAIGRSSVEVIPRQESKDRAEMMAELMLRGETWSGEYEASRRDGSIVAVQVTNTPVFDRDGKLVAVIGSSIDITERRAGDQARRLLSAIVDGSGDAIFASTVDGILTSWNRAAEELFGYTAEEAIGQPVSLIAPPGRASEQTGMRRRLNAGGPHERLETVRLRKDGSPGRRVDHRVDDHRRDRRRGRTVGDRPRHHGAAGRPTHVGVEPSAIGRGAKDRACRQLRSRSPGPRSDLVRGVLSNLRPRSRCRTQPRVAHGHCSSDRRTEGARRGDRHRHQGPSDRSRLSHHPQRLAGAVVARPSRTGIGNDGAVVKVTGTIMDDTERVAADRVRRAAETRFEIGFEQSAIGAAITEPSRGSNTCRTRRCARSWGARPSSSSAAGGRNTGTRRSSPLAHMALTTIGRRSRHSRGRTALLPPDGTVVWVSAHVTLVRDEADAPQYFFAQFQDISERKRMEHDLAHQALHDSLTGLPNRAAAQ